MRIGALELSDETLELLYGLPRSNQEEARRLFIMVNGYGPLTPRESFTHNLISTSISRIESWCLSLSSRVVRGLNISYWIFTALFCITLFTSHWSTSLAFLIPALILNLLREAHNLSKIASDLPSGALTNGI